MKDEINDPKSDKIISSQAIYGYDNTVFPRVTSRRIKLPEVENHYPNLAEILVISSYPPRECGIATYSQ
ncbi:MAG TPA: hypothetical protein VI413_13605, partial [Paludibacter sp.]